MILVDTEIQRAIRRGDIQITPYNPDNLGSNSYDITLSDILAVYTTFPLDPVKDNPVRYYRIPKTGVVLEPGKLYLGSTNEHTYTPHHVPMLEGRSSIGRLGIDVHATAGVGDIGFKGYWTLEISVKHPVRVYPGLRIGQVLFYKVEGRVTVPYDEKLSSRYSGQSKLPTPSRYYQHPAGTTKIQINSENE